MPLSPEERRLRARFAAIESWATEPDPTARTAPARQAFRAKFLDLADPEGKLPAAERERRAGLLRRAHYVRMAFAAAKAKRLKQEAAAARANGNGGRKRKPAAAPGTIRGQTDHHQPQPEPEPRAAGGVSNGSTHTEEQIHEQPTSGR